MQPVAGTWEGWKAQLAEAVQLGRSMEMSDEQMAERAQQVGNFLAQKIDPRSPEQRVLKELWETADENEQRAIASVLIKLVSDKQVH